MISRLYNLILLDLLAATSTTMWSSHRDGGPQRVALPLNQLVVVQAATQLSSESLGGTSCGRPLAIENPFDPTLMTKSWRRCGSCPNGWNFQSDHGLGMIQRLTWGESPPSGCYETQSPFPTLNSTELKGLSIFGSRS